MRKRRMREHIIAGLSANHVERHALLCPMSKPWRKAGWPNSSQSEEITMLSEQQRIRFSELQQREEDATLNSSEQEELDSLIRIIETKEKEYLQPAIERLQQEHLKIQAQNDELKILSRRQKRLVRHLERVLAAAQTESTAIRTLV